jgi:hypothetical protein
MYEWRWLPLHQIRGSTTYYGQDLRQTDSTSSHERDLTRAHQTLVDAPNSFANLSGLSNRSGEIGVFTSFMMTGDYDETDDP